MAKIGAVRFIVREVLRSIRNVNEATTTASVAGYNTPYAFSDDSDNNKKKKYLEKLGYTVVSENRWLQLKKDVTRDNKQKINDGIRHIKKQLSEIEKYLNWYGRLRQEGNLSSDTYYKRTALNLERIKEKAIRIQEKIDELTTDEK
jgi:type I restriction-modification system DNA methylase subunit